MEWNDFHNSSGFDFSLSLKSSSIAELKKLFPKKLIVKI